MPTSVLLISESIESFGLIGDCLRYNGYSPRHSHPSHVARAGRHQACMLLCRSTEAAIATLASCRIEGHAPPVLALLEPGAATPPAALLNAGADVVLALPVPADHLIAQLKASLRRSVETLEGSLTFGSLTLIPREQVVLRDGEAVTLTAAEFKMLRTLMRRPGAIVSRHTLAQCLPDPQKSDAAHSVAVHIHHLRCKLGPNLIRTVRSLGYSMMPIN